MDYIHWQHLEQVGFGRSSGKKDGIQQKALLLTSMWRLWYLSSVGRGGGAMF